MLINTLGHHTLKSIGKRMSDRRRISIHVFVSTKPSSRPSTKSFLIFGHILVLKVSQNFLNLTK